MRLRAGRRRITPLFALLAAALAAAGCGGEGGEADGSERSGRDGAVAKPGGARVAISKFEYRPATATVRAGDAVTFTNRDRASHTATADPGAPAGFDTGRVQKGQEKKVVPRRPGTYAYRCDFHPFMKAELRVTR